MKEWRKKMLSAVSAAAVLCMVSIPAVPAMAAARIDDVQIDISWEDQLYAMGAGDIVDEQEPSAYGGSYWIEDYSISGSTNTPKDSYTYTIDVMAESGYQFTNDTVVTVYGAYDVETYLRTTRLMRIRAKAYPFYVLETVKGISVDEASKKVTWDPVEYAKNYSVCIHYTTQNGSEKSVRKTTSKTELDLTTYLNKYEDVYVYVMAKKGSTTADRYIAESWYTDGKGGEDWDHSPEEISFRIPAATNKDGLIDTSGGTTSGGGSASPGPGGTTGPGSPSNSGIPSGSSGPAGPGGVSGPGSGGSPQGSSGYTGWQGSGNSWCYLRNGTRVTGWLAINPEEWYFLDQYGNMAAGWYNDNGNVYLLNTQHDGTYGKMLTGFQFYNGNWYYFNEQHDGFYGALNRNLPAGYWVDSGGALHW